MANPKFFPDQPFTLKDLLPIPFPGILPVILLPWFKKIVFFYKAINIIFSLNSIGKVTEKFIDHFQSFCVNNCRVKIIAQ